MPRMQEQIGKKKQSNIFPFIPDGNFCFAKGVEAFQKTKFKTAIKWLKKAVELAPNEPLYQCQLSIVYTETGAFHAANDLLTNVLKMKDHTYPDCYYLLANNYAHLGLLNEASKYALTYLEKDIDGEFVEEAKILLELLDIDDDEEDEWNLDDEDELLIYQESVFHHMESFEWEQAIELLEEMMTLFPDHLPTKHDHAHALYFSGNQAEAIAQELAELEKDPTALYSHTNLATFYYEQNDEAACAEHIKILSNVYPIHEQQKLKIAVTLARTGYDAAAYPRFRVLIKSFVKGHPSYYRWYSRTAFNLGHTEKAVQIWKEGKRKHSQLINETMPWEK